MVIVAGFALPTASDIGSHMSQHAISRHATAGHMPAPVTDVVDDVVKLQPQSGRVQVQNATGSWRDTMYVDHNAEWRPYIVLTSQPTATALGIRWSIVDDHYTVEVQAGESSKLSIDGHRVQIKVDDGVETAQDLADFIGDQLDGKINVTVDEADRTLQLPIKLTLSHCHRHLTAPQLQTASLRTVVTSANRRGLVYYAEDTAIHREVASYVALMMHIFGTTYYAGANVLQPASSKPDMSHVVRSQDQGCRGMIGVDVPTVKLEDVDVVESIVDGDYYRYDDSARDDKIAESEYADIVDWLHDVAQHEVSTDDLSEIRDDLYISSVPYALAGCDVSGDTRTMAAWDALVHLVSHYAPEHLDLWAQAVNGGADEGPVSALKHGWVTIGLDAKTEYDSDVYDTYMRHARSFSEASRSTCTLIANRVRQRRDYQRCA